MGGLFMGGGDQKIGTRKNFLFTSPYSLELFLFMPIPSHSFLPLVLRHLSAFALSSARHESITPFGNTINSKLQIPNHK
jgi:hypothetical protein